MKPAPRIGAGYWALNVQVANHAEEMLDNVPIQVGLVTSSREWLYQW